MSRRKPSEDQPGFGPQHGDLTLALASAAAGVDPFAETALEPEVTPIEHVDAALIRETILGGIALVQAKVISGRFAKMDAETLEKLLDMAARFADVGKAVDTVQAFKRSVKCHVPHHAEQPVETSELLQKLRAISGGKR